MPKTDQDQLRDLHTLLAQVKKALLSEDIERAHIARWVDGGIKICERLENES